MAGHVISADCNIKLVIPTTQRYVEHVLVGMACGGEEAWPRHLMNTTHTDTQCSASHEYAKGYVEHMLVGVACGGEEAWPRHLMNTTHTDTQHCKAWPHIS